MNLHKLDFESLLNFLTQLLSESDGYLIDNVKESLPTEVWEILEGLGFQPEFAVAGSFKSTYQIFPLPMQYDTDGIPLSWSVNKDEFFFYTLKKYEKNQRLTLEAFRCLNQ